MSKKPASTTALNDDIGEAKRLELYRTQVVIREAETRAFDLFLQNLVKGTSHLSLGQEAVAAGFGLGFLSAHAVQLELELGRLAIVKVKGFPLIRQWYVVRLRDRRLPRLAEAFRAFLVEDGARLIRKHEKGA